MSDQPAQGFENSRLQIGHTLGINTLRMGESSPNRTELRDLRAFEVLLKKGGASWWAGSFSQETDLA